MTTNKVFFGGLATVAFAATTLINVSSTNANPVVTPMATPCTACSSAPSVPATPGFVSATGFSNTSGSTHTGLTTFGQSTGVATGPSGTLAGSITGSTATPNSAGTTTIAGGATGTPSGSVGLVGLGIASSGLVLTPTGSTAGGTALAGNNGKGISGASTFSGVTQIGHYGTGGAGAIFGTTGTK